MGTNALSSVNPAVRNQQYRRGFWCASRQYHGFYNTAVGTRALEQNTTGNFNMAIGTEALNQNNANFNLAIGFRVGFLNTTGNHLTGIGAAAMRNNTTGGFNTAIGADALRENTTTALTSLSVTRRWQFSMARWSMALTRPLVALRSRP